MATPNFSVENNPNPAGYAAAVTPSDSVDFTQMARGLYIGGAGNVVVLQQDGTTVTFVGLQAGQILPVRAVRVNSTNTTATSIVALY